MIRDGLRSLVLLSLFGCPAFAARAAPPAQVRAVVLDGSLPADLAEPEGRSRWDLTGLTLGSAPDPSVYSDPAAGDAAERWVRPERFAAGKALGARETLKLEEKRDGRVDRLWIEVEIVGVGWVHLPSGPREVELERALVLRKTADRAGYSPDRLVHRWVDPQVGVVAEVWGPASADGRHRLSVSGATLAGDSLAVTSLTKLYVDEVISPPPNGSLNYGWNRGRNVPVSSFTSPSYATIGDLINASTWDFSSVPATTTLAGTTTANNSTTINGSGTQFANELKVGDKVALSSAPAVFARVTAVNTNGTQITVSAALGNGTAQTILRRRNEIASTTVSINSSETCNSTNCGYNRPGTWMDREDENFDDLLALYKTNAVNEREDHPGTDVTIWLRAGAQNEGGAGSLGTGESKFCYANNGATTRTPVPLWVFPHQDAGGYYFQPGDSWSSAVFPCEQSIFNQICTQSCGLFCALYAGAGSGHTGTQNGAVIKSGVVTLPSGHTFNALLARTVADFCAFLLSGCGSCLSPVRTVVYLWQAPYLGTLIQLQSVQNAPDLTSFTVVDSSDIGFGLFPPRTIQVTGTTGTTASLSWDPGLDTHRITDYKIYWDTDSGAATPYGFNSVSNAGQVSFLGTTATISGLTAGTTYYFTVTARSTFTDPSSSAVTNYESLLYPRQVSGDPSFVYPIEVQGATTGGSCIPSAEVTGLTVGKSGGNIQICWNPVSDPCLLGYRVLGATSPTAPGNFSTVADTGLETCWTGSPTQGYFLVVARGTGGTGPWGHYGQ